MQWPGLRQGARDEEAISRRGSPAGFAEDQRLEGRHLSGGHLSGMFVLDPRLAWPYELAQLGPAICKTIVLQIKVQFRKDNVIDRAMRPVFDDVRLSRSQPFVQAQTIRTKEMLQAGPNLPADAAAFKDDKIRHRVHPC